MLRKFLLTLVLSLPPVLAGIYLYCYGVNVLFADEFRFVDMAWAGHLPPWRELIALHIDHIIMFPRIVYFYLAKFSSMNSLAACWLSFALVCLLYLLVIRGAMRHFSGRAAPFGLIVCLFIGVALFHPAQRENMFWGFQITYMMCFVFAGLSFFFFDLALTEERERNIPLLAATCCAVISSFSSSMGFVIWPVILFSWLLIAGKKALLSYRFYLFCLVAALVFGVFFALNAERGSHSGLSGAIQNPVAAIQYFFVLLDNACGDARQPFVKGIVLFLSVLAICIHFVIRRTRQLLFPFMIAAFGLGVSVLIALARCRFGWINALFPSSRYNLFPLTALWGAILYTGFLAVDLKGRYIHPLRIALAGSIFLAGLWLFVSLPDHLEQTRLLTHAALEKRAYLMRTLAFQPDEALGILTKNPLHLRQLAGQLEEKSLNVYAKSLKEPTVFGASPRPLANDAFVVDDLAVKYNGQRGRLHIEGWLYDQGGQHEAASAWLNIGGQRFPLFYGVARQDVAAYFPATLCGFEGDIDLAVLTPGTYPLKLDAVNYGGLAWQEKDMGITLAFDGQRFALWSGKQKVESVIIPSLSEKQRLPSLGVFSVDGAEIHEGDKGPELYVWGWAYDPRIKRAIQHGWLTVGGRSVPLRVGIWREDVVKYLGDKRFGPSGFLVTFPLCDLAAGAYAPRISMDTRGGLALYEQEMGYELIWADGRWSIRAGK